MFRYLIFAVLKRFRNNLWEENIQGWTIVEETNYDWLQHNHYYSADTTQLYFCAVRQIKAADTDSQLHALNLLQFRE